MKVTVTEPGIAGSYVLEERNPDGSMLLRPDTSVDEMQRRVGGRPMTDEESRTRSATFPLTGRVSRGRQPAVCRTVRRRGVRRGSRACIACLTSAT